MQEKSETREEYTLKLFCENCGKEEPFTLEEETDRVEVYKCPVCGMKKSFAI